MNACELFSQLHELEDKRPTTNAESLEIIGALVSLLLRREIERDAAKGPDQPLDMKRLRDMVGLIGDLLNLERKNDPTSREVTVRFIGDAEAYSA